MTAPATLWYSSVMPSSVRKVWLGDDEWTDWTKLALFASDSGDGRQIGDIPADPDAGATLKLPEVGWVSGWGKLAVIVDLPGPSAIAAGIALGCGGIRPVTCINCSSDTDELIDMSASKGALVSAAHRYSVWRSNEKGVAFIVDSRRLGANIEPSPRQFDNRWALYETDLPDQAALAKQGIASVVVLQEGEELNEDLASIVTTYQDAGLIVGIADVKRRAISPAKHHKRGWLTKLADAFMGGVDFKRRADGGYGRRVPVPPEPSHG